jgi:hypothetical protein
VTLEIQGLSGDDYQARCGRVRDHQKHGAVGLFDQRGEVLNPSHFDIWQAQAQASRLKISDLIAPCEQENFAMTIIDW